MSPVFALSLRSIERGGAPIDPIVARRILSLVPHSGHDPQPAHPPQEPEALDLGRQQVRAQPRHRLAHVQHAGRAAHHRGILGPGRHNH